MSFSTNIALSMPGTKKPGRHFYLRLKQNLSTEPSEFKKPGKLVVISDIEGNFRPFLQLLLVNKVIDRHLNWIFDEGHLVILGDCFDRGEQVVECLWLIYSLEEKAKAKGGYVHFILGNHEIMNLNGDWRYVHPKYAQSSKIPYTALYNGNNELWHWLCTKNIIEKIGNILFVHGGIAQELLQTGLSVHEINDLARPWYTRANVEFSDKLLSLIFNSENSPFWFRGYYKIDFSQEIIDQTLSHFNVQTIITGHTTVEEVTTYFEGKVINVDTDHAGNKSGSLLIKKEKFYKVSLRGKKERIR